jgi:mRNA interferase RelE/StbE
MKPQAIKDAKRIPKIELKRIFAKIEELKEGLQGDIKRLTNFTPEYRLRIGNYRILFEIESSNVIVIYKIKHRKEAYK